MATQGSLLWEPTSRRISESAMTRFRSAVAPHCPDSQALHDWSVADLAGFWQAAWNWCGMVGDSGPGPAVAGDWTGDLRAAEFFPTADVSYAENLLSGGDRADAAPEAIVALREDGRRETLAWEQLNEQVAACRGWLASQGVEPGDHVAAWMPNVTATVIAMLATNALGAVFTSTSPDFGVAGVLDRFAQMEPKVLIACDGYRYAGKAHDRLSLLPEVVAGLPSLAVVALVGEVAQDQAIAGEALGGVGVAAWSDILATTPTDLPPRRAGFREPGFVLYSSGTTGKPKCIVHAGPSILLKQMTEHQLHCDITAGDRVFYFTTCGWMMWNWLVAALASGATIVLFDGSPFEPGPSAMWDLVERERVTLFGTSAKFIDASLKAGVLPAQTHDLSALRTITSTGSPLSAEGFDYVYRDVKADLHLASISGGTDLCGCFVLGDPTRPVYAGEIQTAALGTAADVWDDEGHSLADRPGIRGELVCTAPFPSMPIRFAGDEMGERYRAAYFDRFPGVWAHGDFASRTEHGGFVIHGRSDATLNAGGVRIGTAEIYRQVEQLPEIAEALAIGQEWDDDTRIVLFVRLADPAGGLGDATVTAIKRRLRTQASPRHVPARVVAVPDLPRTRSGKLAELAVADVVHGRDVRNTEALANPESLEFFVDLAELRV